VDVVAFYRGEAPDYKGRTLQALWEWDDEHLEDSHDYIQVLFPLKEPSYFNERAPLLDDASVAAFRADDRIKSNLLRSFDRMLRFYGFRRDEQTGEVVEAENFAARATEWLTPGDHNHLRVTRVMKCLALCGLGAEAAAFQKRLLAVADPRRVSAESVYYWRNALAPRRGGESPDGGPR
jgi:hypothetical protein